MLPLSLLKATENQPMLIELKNGDTYNGSLVSCNIFMNICLKDVICTSKDGNRFWKMSEVFIRGQSIKYLRIPDEIIDTVAEEEQRDRRNALRGKGGRNAGRIGGRGDDSGRGRGSRESGGRGSYNYNSGGRGGGPGRGGYEGRGGRGGRGSGGRGNYNNNNNYNASSSSAPSSTA